MYKNLTKILYCIKVMSIMNIKSATFVRGVTDSENMVKDDLPQVAFIGRSNVGKSSLINSITKNKGLARTSSTAGRTQEINFFLINKYFYLVDLPGYGFAGGSHGKRDLMTERIAGYLFESGINQYKVVLIIDAKVGITENDKSMFRELMNNKKDIIIVANKIDKVNQSEKQKTMNTIKQFVGEMPIVQFSSLKKIGIGELTKMILPK